MFNYSQTYRSGKILGYVLGYVMFTMMLFFVLSILKKLPASWSFFHIGGVTLLLAVTGFGLKQWLR